MEKKKIFLSLLLTLKHKNLQEIPEREILFFPGMETGLLAELNKEREEFVTILGNSPLYLDHFSNV